MKLRRFWINWGKWKLKANLDPVQEEKQKAALVAVKHVKDRFVVGLGSGSTAAFAIEALGERIKMKNCELLVFQLLIRHFCWQSNVEFRLLLWMSIQKLT